MLVEGRREAIYASRIIDHEPKVAQPQCTQHVLNQPFGVAFSQCAILVLIHKHLAILPHEWCRQLSYALLAGRVAPRGFWGCAIVKSVGGPLCSTAPSTISKHQVYSSKVSTPSSMTIVRVAVKGSRRYRWPDGSTLPHWSRWEFRLRGRSCICRQGGSARYSVFPRPCKPGILLLTG